MPDNVLVPRRNLVLLHNCVPAMRVYGARRCPRKNRANEFKFYLQGSLQGGTTRNFLAVSAGIALVCDLQAATSAQKTTVQINTHSIALNCDDVSSGLRGLLTGPGAAHLNGGHVHACTRICPASLRGTNAASVASASAASACRRPLQVVLNVVVPPKSGRPVGGLKERDFTILDNKAPQTITSFSAVDGGQAPVEVVVVIDAVNIGYENVALQRVAAKSFCGSLRAGRYSAAPAPGSSGSELARAPRIQRFCLIANPRSP